MRKVLITVLVIALCAGLVIGGSIIASRLLTGKPIASEGCTATVNGGTAELSVDQAEYASLITALSVRQKLPPRAATIALATAFQESGLRNLDWGDRDSVGLFQQRPSMGWGTREQILDPYYATGKFYEHLVKVDRYTSLEITDAAQKVQRSADGLAYAQHEPDSRALASSLTGQSPAAFTCTLLEPPKRPQSSTVTINSELARALGASTLSAPASAANAPNGVKAPAKKSAPADKSPVRVKATSAAFGWAVAHWSVANAKRLGIVAVTHSGKRWDATKSEEGWLGDQKATKSEVVIRLA